jgi:CheY-like chemotaxis protein
MADRTVPIRIVIAEDNTADVMLVREALNAHGIPFEMTHLKDGAEAVATLCGNQPGWNSPDLILLDLNMPKLGGLEVLSAIRKDAAFNNVPIIVLTSSPAPEEQQAARRLGVVHYLQKPSDLYEFIEQIGGAIQEAIRQRCG